MTSGAIELSTPYDTIKSMLGGNKPTWINEQDALRIGAYNTYEDIYWNKPGVFEILMIGTNENPRYVPTGRIICNTMNRYVARGFGWAADPVLGTPADRTRLLEYVNSLFRRERFKSKFKSNKLYGIIRGDAAWMISANPRKPEGRRLSIDTVNPGTLFPITALLDPDEHIGIDMVEQFVGGAEGDTIYIKRQRWLKVTHPDHPNYIPEDEIEEGDLEDAFICYQKDVLELEGWETDAAKFVNMPDETVAPTIIEGITALPIYWYSNLTEEDSDWGRSEMTGLETLMAGVNQGLSDQDMAIAMQGVGMYVTNSKPPMDENGNDSDWIFGPGRVLEIGTDKMFERVDGVTSVAASIDHIEMMEERMNRTSGASDVAQGRVDVTVAESGIALQIRMGPLLDEAENKDTLIEDCMMQMFYDLLQWIEVYEGETFGDAVLIPTFGSKLPEDKEARRKALFEGYAAVPPLFSAAYVRRELTRMGWEMDEAEMIREIDEEMAKFSVPAEDDEGARLEAEANGGDPDAEEEI